MALVTFHNVGKEYSGRWVLEGVSFEVQAGRKVGLIGANGSGKTTLLRILCGQVQPNSGSVGQAGDLRIGYVPQQVEFVGEETVTEFIHREHAELTEHLREREAALETADAEQMDRLLKEYEVARLAFDQLGGDHFEQRAAAMLDALGLSERTDQPVRNLSGGEKNVLSMTQAILNDPNLLILDEPGNHLDYLGLAWLEDFLNRFRGAVLVVSHNRYLLDRVVGQILELDGGKLTAWPGNYSAYRQLKAEKLKAQQSEYNAYQQRLAHMKALVQKFADIAQGHASDQSWGKRLSARRSQLERLKKNGVDKPQAAAAQVGISFQAEATRADIALQLKGYGKAYDDLTLLEDVNWDLAGGQRWALVGANGCGKTSMLREIINEGDWEHETIRIGPSLTVGYCAQEQEVLDGDNTVYDELLLLPDAKHEQVLGILARFLFTDEEVYKKVRDLSGGERNRLQLARLMLLRPNFLILDEPTNHLDIATCEAVEEALSEFEGTLLVVSHDRYFLDKVTNHVAQVHERDLRLFNGNYTDFWNKYQSDGETVAGRVVSRRIGREKTITDKDKSGGEAWQQRKAEAAALRKTQKRVEKLEEDIEALESQKAELESQVAGAFSSGEIDKGKALSTQLEAIAGQIEVLHEQWLESSEELFQEN